MLVHKSPAIFGAGEGATEAIHDCGCIPTKPATNVTFSAGFIRGFSTTSQRNSSFYVCCIVVRVEHFLRLLPAKMCNSRTTPQPLTAAVLPLSPFTRQKTLLSSLHQKNACLVNLLDDMGTFYIYVFHIKFAYFCFLAHTVFLHRLLYAFQPPYFASTNKLKSSKK